MMPSSAFDDLRNVQWLIGRTKGGRQRQKKISFCPLDFQPLLIFVRSLSPPSFHPIIPSSRSASLFVGFTCKMSSAQVLNVTLPALSAGWSADKDFKAVGKVSAATQRNLEPVGPHFLAHARRVRFPSATICVLLNFVEASFYCECGANKTNRSVTTVLSPRMSASKLSRTSRRPKMMRMMKSPRMRTP